MASVSRLSSCCGTRFIRRLGLELNVAEVNLMQMQKLIFRAAVSSLLVIFVSTTMAGSSSKLKSTKTALNKLKVRTPASFQQMQLAEGKCAYIPEAVPGDFLVITPRKSKGFSFCTANAYCKLDGEIRPQRLFCSVENGRCPANANVCAADKFAKYKDGTPKN